MRRVLLFLALLGALPLTAAAGQTAPTVIDTGSRTYKLIDGGDVLVGALSDTLSPDTYVYHPAPGAKTISYVTDRGRADFTVKPGESYDFAIRYNGKLYPQRIAASDPTTTIGYRGAASGVDVIPFRLGPNNAIHVTASINGSAPLDLIFDTGASLSVLAEQGKAKGATIAAGHANRIVMGGVTLERADVIFIDFHGTAKNDGVLGYDVFAGRVVAIDYDRSVMTISAAMPALDPGYRKVPIVWKGAVAQVPLTIDVAGQPRSILALFDTGSKWSLSLCGADTAARAGLDQLPVLGSRISTTSAGERIPTAIVTLPALSIAGYRLPDVQADLEPVVPGGGHDFNIIGNDFLKRFNAVVDYRTGEIWLKPNGLRDEPYNRVFDKRLLLIGAATLPILTVGILLLRRRRRRRIPADS